MRWFFGKFKRSKSHSEINWPFKDLKLLVRHYGLAHKMVLKLLNERAGIMDSFDDSILKQYETQESNRDCCPLCKSSFGGRYMLLRHLADCHFRERLCQGLPSGADVYKCPECNHESKGQLISRCPFGFFKSPKKPKKIFVRIYALAS